MFDLIYPTPAGLDKLKGKKPASHPTGQPRPAERSAATAGKSKTI
jgi:hypothetical protein